MLVQQKFSWINHVYNPSVDTGLAAEIYENSRAPQKCISRAKFFSLWEYECVSFYYNLDGLIFIVHVILL